MRCFGTGSLSISSPSFFSVRSRSSSEESRLLRKFNGVVSPVRFFDDALLRGPFLSFFTSAMNNYPLRDSTDRANIFDNGAITFPFPHSAKITSILQTAWLCDSLRFIVIPATEAVVQHR